MGCDCDGFLIMLLNRLQVVWSVELSNGSVSSYLSKD